MNGGVCNIGTNRVNAEIIEHTVIVSYWNCKVCCSLKPTVVFDLHF